MALVTLLISTASPVYGARTRARTLLDNSVFPLTSYRSTRKLRVGFAVAALVPVAAAAGLFVLPPPAPSAPKLLGIPTTLNNRQIAAAASCGALPRAGRRGGAICRSRHPVGVTRKRFLKT